MRRIHTPSLTCACMHDAGSRNPSSFNVMASGFSIHIRRCSYMAIHKLFSVMLTEMYTYTHICMYVYYVYLLSLLTGSSGTAVTGLSTSIGRAHSRTASCSHHTRIVMLSAWSIVGWMYLMLCVLVSWSAVTLMCRGKCSVSKPTSTKGVPSPLSHFSSAAQAFEDEMSTQDRTPRSTRYVSH